MTSNKTERQIDQASDFVGADRRSTEPAEQVTSLVDETAGMMPATSYDWALIDLEATDLAE